MTNSIDAGAGSRHPRLVALTCMLVALLVGGAVAEAVLPCDYICTPETSCAKRCSDEEGLTTCGDFGVCQAGPPPCPTVKCAAGCATKPSFTMQVGDGVTFTANTSNIDPATTDWDLGDGHHDNGNGTVTLTHHYGGPGTYHVCLRAVESTCDTWQTTCKNLTLSQGGGGCVTGGGEEPCPSCCGGDFSEPTPSAGASDSVLQ